MPTAAIARVEPKVIPAEIRTMLVEITPAYAAQLLANNPRNRRPKEVRIARYAKAMSAGKWRVTGETVVVDRNGDLVDGQNRLAACVRADVPFLALLVTGVAPEVFAVTGSGAPRSAGDTIDIAEGLTAGRSKAAAAKILRRVRSGNWSSNHNRAAEDLMTNEDVWVLWRSEPGLAAAWGLVTSLKPRLSRLLPDSMACVLWFLFDNKSPELAATYMQQLASGAGLNEGDPALTVRRALERYRADGIGGRDALELKGAAVARGWSFLRAGKPMERVIPIRSDSWPTID